MLRKIIDKFLSRKVLLSRFAVVGVSGIVVNMGVLALLTKVWDVNVDIAGLIAIELSIINNFVWNNFWTWSGEKKTSIWNRFIKYHLVTLVSGGVNYVTLLYLHKSAGLDELIANSIGIILGTAINFILNHYWTFQRADSDNNN